MFDADADRAVDEPLGADKSAVIRALAQRVVAQGRATDADALYADAWAREMVAEESARVSKGGVLIG